jgi:DNA-binding LacI/PurR family transcriptional regulator
MANIKEVAKLANASIATVSRVLNGTGYVGAETRVRVLEAIKVLNYQPLARDSGNRETRTIGLVVPNIENPFFGRMARHLSAAANGFAYNILLFNLEGAPNDDAMFELIDHRVDGLIYASSHRSMEVIQAARSKNMPMVVLDRETPNARINSVSVNNNYGAFIATEHLISLGHRRIAYLGGAAGMEISVRRKEGYLRALAEYGIAAAEAYVGYGDYTMPSGFEAMKRLYQAHPEITGVIAANDLMIIGALHYLNKSGVRVPEDVSLIGFDNIELARESAPALTTVEYPMERMSALVVDLILRQIKEGDDTPEAVTLFPKLIVRESCAAAPDTADRGKKGHHAQ